MSLSTTKEAVNYWLRFYDGELSDEEAIVAFLCNRVSLQELEDSEVSYSQQKEIATHFLKRLLSFPLENMPSLLKMAGCLECVSASNVPQFSNFTSALIYLPKLLNDSQESMAHKEVGYALHQDCSSELAATKYGENHAKLAISCGLAVFSEKAGRAGVRISILGSSYCDFDAESKLNLLTKLCYRIPLVQHAVISEDKNASIEASLNVLSDSTRKRRRHNAYTLLAYALNE